MPDYLDRIESLFSQSGPIRPIRLIRQIQRTLWENVGPARTAAQCQAAIAEIRDLAAAAQNLRVSDLRTYNTEALDAIELSFMLVVGEMIASSALARKETRGAHLRLDHPEKAETPCNVVVWKENNEMKTRLAPSPGTSHPSDRSDPTDRTDSITEVSRP